MENSQQSNFGANDQGKRDSVAGAVKAELAELAEPLKGKAEELAREKREAGMSHVHTIATAVHGAARELESGMPRLASSVHDVAQRIENTAEDLRHRDLDELIDQVSRYARQQPAIVFGGAVAAGFILTRFLKSSSAASTRSSPDRESSMSPGGNSGSSFDQEFGERSTTSEQQW